MDKIYEISKKWVTDISHMLELIAGVFVLIAVLVAMLSLIPHIPQLWNEGADSESFLAFIEQVFLVVVGIEFMKMLCRPSADNVLETIIFLVARHMIVVTTTTPLDDLISTISIVILCVMRRYLKENRMKDQARERVAQHFGSLFGTSKPRDVDVQEVSTKEESTR